MIAIACSLGLLFGGVLTLIVAIPLAIFTAPHLARYLKGRYGRN